MAKAGRFEDLIVWQEASALCKEGYAASKKGAFARDFEMSLRISARKQSLSPGVLRNSFLTCTDGRGNVLVQVDQTFDDLKT